MFVSMKEILDRAKEGGYGVTAPNVWGEDDVRAAIEAAEENNSPMILDFGMMGSPRVLLEQARMIIDMARSSRVPICLNQDHGQDYESAVWCMKAGFTSIMVDRSDLPFEENVAQVSELVKIAHTTNVTVEAELGHVPFGDEKTQMTDPNEAAEYVKQTGIDCLAVSIGTAHGVYETPPKLDFDRLAALRKAADIPFVLHGGSGTGDEQLAKACREGINKVNLNTYLMRAGNKAIVDSGFPNPKMKPGQHIYFVKKVYQSGWKDELIHYMKLFGQCGKAK